MEFIPWIEKYRPTTFDNIVLDDINRRILNNIIENNYFPNILFYGPPGTGKTTTIINLINTYQKKYNLTQKGSKIHLNASDDRGIETIRIQINNFVKTKPLFNSKIKFVIFDEVDYMTKNAQFALRHLIQKQTNNVRFCLICNFITRIDDTLQNEFIRLKFSNLPINKIIALSKNIIKKEKINISDDQLKIIIQKYQSDIRSIINFLQLSLHKDNKYKLIHNDFYLLFLKKIKEEDICKLKKFIIKKSRMYDISINTMMKNIIETMINSDKNMLTPQFLDFFNIIFHNEGNLLLDYFILSLKELL